MKIESVGGNTGFVTMFIEKSMTALLASIPRLDFRLKELPSNQKIKTLYLGEISKISADLRDEHLNPELIRLSPEWTHVVIYTVICSNTELFDEFFKAEVYRGDDQPGSIIRDYQAERLLTEFGNFKK